MKSFLSLIIFFVMINQTNAQELPYYEIPEAPEKYTAGAVASRLIDGLGFRYYWATKDLTEKDLKYKPGDKTRSVFDTADHILVLSIMTLSAVENTTMTFPKEGSLTFEEMRALTLKNFKKASDILKEADDISKFVMKIKRGNGKVEEYPFWNQLNGPIADAIWHCGQIVSFRRSSGNPFPKGVSLLTGKIRK
ncbi:DinB family protein [Tenacibaculum sp. MEBiC06402]|uniref:DinB family protein n=1 Tax=unclassified Tenacibaculum TaxID=2635139 RepID=UPI003B9BC522